MMRRGGALLRLVAVTVLLPLAVVSLGMWEGERVAAEMEDLAAERLRAEKAVAVLEARAGPDGQPDMGARFRSNGRSYAGPLALSKAREALGDVEDAMVVARVRSALPPVVVISAASSAGLSVLVLLGGWVLGRRGRASRDSLLRGFSFARRVLPFVLGTGVVLAAAAFISAVAFEAGALLHPGDTSNGEVKALMLAVALILVALYVAGSALLGLRRSLAAFAPDPLPILGRPVSREEAPGLWRLLDDLAARLGALRPDAVVVGLTGGFFVSSGPKVLEPAGTTTGGRTLYVPLPVLPLLRADEAGAIIGHELAHFSGDDTEYSLRFLPIYAGVERSLDAVAAAGAHEGAAFPLLRPALMLGTFVMERFHLAVRHWSRRREFAADAAGAAVTSPDAAARALLRSPAVRPRIEDVLRVAARSPDDAPTDIVAEVFRHVAAAGPDDPAGHLEDGEPHPTDTHPPTRQRLAALGRAADAGLLAEAAAAPAGDGLSRLGEFFADPDGLCRDATADFLAVIRRGARAFREELEALAAAVEPDERVLTDNVRPGGIIIVCMGAFFGLIGLALAVFDPTAMNVPETQILIGAALVMALGLCGWGGFLLWRGNRPFLVLRPEEAMIPGLDAPMAWRNVVQLDVFHQGKGATARFTLVSGAPFPRRVPGGRRAKLDARARTVTVTAVLPKGMNGPEFAELVGRYRGAAEARRLLARGPGVAEESWLSGG